jgi:CheY-like chemotaxis protein
MNIVTNAREAIHGEGKVVISSWNETLDDETAVEFGIRPGPYSVIGVSDTGPGIAEKDVPHIFEPFYTRKVMGKSGSGLGLTVVWNSIVDLGGTVRVKTGPEGTLFKLYFPASATPIKEKEKPRAVADLHGRGEKILVVDDDPLQRDIAEELLKALQYEAVCVSSGEEALAYVQAHPVDLVLLDMVMDPGINGYETYRRMITIRPGLKAVIASGFSDSEDVRNTLALGAGGLIAKPYSMETLGKAIQSQLS